LCLELVSAQRQLVGAIEDRLAIHPELISVVPEFRCLDARQGNQFAVGPLNPSIDPSQVRPEVGASPVSVIGKVRAHGALDRHILPDRFGGADPGGEFAGNRRRQTWFLST
jgi:hypothetical protein